MNPVLIANAHWARVKNAMRAGHVVRLAELPDPPRKEQLYQARHYVREKGNRSMR